MPEEQKEKKLTKKELRILARQQREAEQAAAASGAGASNFGDQPMVQSITSTITDRQFVDVRDLGPELAGQTVWVRAFLQTVRGKGKIAFAVLRQTVGTVQAVAAAGGDIPKQMIKFMGGVPPESVVDVQAEVSVPEQPVLSCTQTNVELQVKQFWTVAKSESQLPFQLEDAMRPEQKEGEEDDNMPRVGLDTRLDFRCLDLRTPANQAIFRIQSAVGMLFREYLYANNFVEIHTPKLLPGASEGGASVFELEYFGRQACLAQSPQFYKEMMCANAGFERVFEVGPVFRAENSNTHRHLCEFTGLDMEMVIKEHYYEVLDMFSGLFCFIFSNLESRFGQELNIIAQQYPFEPLRYHNPTLRISFAEGIALLQESGQAQDLDPMGDLSTPNEKLLGRLVREKYGTDVYFMDKYPMAARPFYTMPDPEDPQLSQSYDFFIRGEEITSGAQRCHDVETIRANAALKGIEEETIQNYIDSFRFGSLPHGGGGVGLERVVMLYLNLGNIRRVSAFPRDPRRLGP